MGSTIKRLDRQIDINEQEFLSILHGLNLARLRQSCISLSSNIAVIDSPFFPLEPQSSKRGILIIAAFLAGFIVVGSVIIGKEMLDSSVRTPERARKMIGLPLAGFTLADDDSKARKQDKESLVAILTEQLINTLLPSITTAIETKDRALVSFITTRPEVYRIKDIEILHEQLESLYDDVFWVVPQSSADVFSSALPAYSFAVYKPATEQLNYKCPDQLIKKDLSANRLVIYVSPTLSHHALPTAIVKSSAANVLAFDAGNTWQSADREFLKKTKDIDRSIPFYTWLVNTSDVNMDNMKGEVQKEQSPLRKKVKETVTLNLK